MMRLRPTWLRTWAGILAIELCLLMGKSSAYPDISGSCNGVFSDAHLPRKVSGDGGFKFRIGPISTNETHKLVNIFIAGTIRPKGLLIKAWDPISGKQMRNSRFQGENWGALRETMDYFDGCPVPMAAVTHTKHVRQLMPLSFTFAWPKDKEASFTAWLVEHEHSWWSISASTAESPAATIPLHCPHQEWGGSASAWLAFFPVVLFVIGALLLTMMPDSWTRALTALQHCYPVAAVCPIGSEGCSSSKASSRLLAWGVSWLRVASINDITAWDVMVSLVFYGCQLGSVWLAMRDTDLRAGQVRWSDKASHHPPEEGAIAPNPLDAPLGRALGTTLQYALGMLLLLPTRKSVWPWLIGIDHSRCIKFHRMVARWTFLLALLHLLFLLEVYGLRDIFRIRPSCHGMGNLYGTLSFACMTAMLLFALEPVRRKCFELFRVTHWLSLGVIGCGCLHSTDLVYYVAPPILLYALDYALRLADWRQSCAVESAKVIGGDVTKLVVRCPRLVQGLQNMESGGVGAYVYLQVNGISGTPMDFHPFSISGFNDEDKEQATCAKSDSKTTEPDLELLSTSAGASNGAFTLHIKDMGCGTWSNCLLEKVSRGDALQVHVEGPYGNSGLVLARYNTVVCVAGGIGFTPMAPFLELVANPEKQHALFPLLRRVQVLWSVQKAAQVSWFEQLLKRCLGMQGSVEISLRVHVTRDAISAGDAEQITCYPGRLNLREEMEAAAFNANRGDADRGSVAVLACGPQSLIAETRKAARVHGFHVSAKPFQL